MLTFKAAGHTIFSQHRQFTMDAYKYRCSTEASRGEEMMELFNHKTQQFKSFSMLEPGNKFVVIGTKTIAPGASENDENAIFPTRLVQLLKVRRDLGFKFSNFQPSQEYGPEELFYVSSGLRWFNEEVAQRSFDDGYQFEMKFDGMKGGKKYMSFTMVKAATDICK